MWSALVDVYHSVNWKNARWNVKKSWYNCCQPEIIFQLAPTKIVLQRWKQLIIARCCVQNVAKIFCCNILCNVNLFSDWALCKASHLMLRGQTAVCICSHVAKHWWKSYLKIATRGSFGILSSLLYSVIQSFDPI